MSETKEKTCPLLLLAEAMGGVKMNECKCLGETCAWWREYTQAKKTRTGLKGYCAICTGASKG